jgi:hypothetical protein
LTVAVLVVPVFLIPASILKTVLVPVAVIEFAGMSTDSINTSVRLEVEASVEV